MDELIKAGQLVLLIIIICSTILPIVAASDRYFGTDPED